MNTVLSSSKLSAPSKLVRRVLSRTSNVGDDKKAKTLKEKTKKKKETASLDLELASLKEQVGILQLTINSLYENCDKKDKALADLAREKQQLSMELKKEQRITLNLEKQLSTEREFYFKEKEQYCQEMNECKKLKKKLSEKLNPVRSDSTETISMRKEIDKLKDALQQTLEVNYNLSIKFLKMRNTKSSFKMRLKKQESDHFEEMQSLEQKVSAIKVDIANIVDKRFLLPISPSNKRFLQIIKQNGVLLHENLCMQMDIDRLSSEIELLQASQIHKKMKKQSKCVYNVTHKPEPGGLGDQDQSSVKLEKEHVHTAKKSKSEGQEKNKVEETNKKIRKTKIRAKKKPPEETCQVVKIFERDETEGVPEIILLSSSNSDKDDARGSHTKLASETMTTVKTFIDVPKSYISISRNSPQDCSSVISSQEPIRITQSAPEIVQTCIFSVNNTKI